MTGALVVAKAPVPGLVKTRLGAEIGHERAASVAAAALLDSVRACTAAFGAQRCALAVLGDLRAAARGADLVAATNGWQVFGQRGTGFGERLRLAHVEAHQRLGRPVIQIGMDTPQVDPGSLLSASAHLRAGADAVLGPAEDGGWWLLGVRAAAFLDRLDEVPMSSASTGEETRSMLVRAGARVVEVGTLRDVDDRADADAVAASAPGSEFAEVWS